MKKITILGLLLISAFTLVGCTKSTPTSETVIPTETIPTVQETPAQTTGTDLTGEVSTGTTATTTTPEAKSYTLEEVAMHSTNKDCWTSINGDVFDITSAFGKHKGGDEALTKLCGKEGTALFEKQHGTNENAKGWLISLRIGRLKQ